MFSLAIHSYLGRVFHSTLTSMDMLLPLTPMTLALHAAWENAGARVQLLAVESPLQLFLSSAKATVEVTSDKVTRKIKKVDR
jgi:hypothetical protein